MRGLTAGTQTGISANVTRPGMLIEIGWPTPARLSTLGDQMFGGNLFSGGDVLSCSANDGGAVVLVNESFAYSALLLTHGAIDVPCKIWAFHAEDVAGAEMLFDGVLAGGEVAADGKVTLSLASVGSATAYAPRRFVNSSAGFNHLTPPGTVVTWGHDTVTL